MENTTTKREAAAYGIGAFFICFVAFMIVRMLMAGSYKDGRMDEATYWEDQNRKLQLDNEALNYQIRQLNIDSVKRLK